MKLAGNVRNFKNNHWNDWDWLEYPFDFDVTPQQLADYLKTCDEYHAKVLLVWCLNSGRFPKDANNGVQHQPGLRLPD